MKCTLLGVFGRCSVFELMSAALWILRLTPSSSLTGNLPTHEAEARTLQRIKCTGHQEELMCQLR